MRTAVISDIHGNLVALNTVLTHLEDIRVDRIVCLGDIVGYNPWPNECVDIIRGRGIPAIMGNHDRVASGLEEPEQFNSVAREAILWTRNRLTEENREFLKDLPERIIMKKGFLLVHGSPSNPDEYILSYDSVINNMEYLKNELKLPVCLFGHTHIVAAFYLEKDIVYSLKDKSIDIEDGKFYLINPGSIGQPRDGDPKASFLVLDEEKKMVEFYRFRYDIASVNRMLVDEGLNPSLGDRLFLGR